jgi:RHS repeat-associated protein
MPTAYQIKDQTTPHYLTFQVVCCLGLFLKTRRHQQLLRIKQQYTVSNNTISKLWAGACEYITENGQQKSLTYLSGPEGVFALHVKSPNSMENIYYIHIEHLGSWNTITDENGNLLQELSFDAWGNRRNPATWRSFTGTPPAPLFDRGFTGHEHFYTFGLINMNGRMYDPLVSRMLSPDNFIQAPDFSQSFNRYSYVWNNPLVYTDPSGEFIFGVLFTKPGYEIQKYFSPIALNIDIRNGRHQKGIGYNVSIGIPKLSPYSVREEHGSTYYWKSYGDYRGWEHREGKEISYCGIFHKGETHYKAGEFTQTVGKRSLGIPSVLGVDVTNDYFSHDGDRFRTSSQVINLGPLRIGNLIFTGDPGPDYETDFFGGDKYGTYVANPYNDPDKYRHGVIYIGLGPINIGWDSEGIRSTVQNTFHDWTGSPHFRDLREVDDEYKKGKFFLQFGWVGW